MTGHYTRIGLTERIISFAVLFLILALILIPYAYIIVTAFKEPGEVFETSWMPERLSFQAWADVFVIYDFHKYLLNSLIAGLGSAILAVIISLPGAYIFARKNFKFRETFFYLIVGTLVFPFILLIVPITIIWIKIGLFNTFIGLWLAFQIFAVPYCVWILRGFFAQLSPHLEEAAMVYGCTQFQAFYKVMVPLAKPVVISVLFLSFLYGWSDFLFSNMLTTGGGPQTASIAIYIATAGGERIEWEMLAVMTLVAGIPPTVVYMMAQKYLSQTFATAT